MNKVEYWIHKNIDDGKRIQLIIAGSGDMSFIIPVEGFKKFVSELAKFNGEYIDIELGDEITISIEADRSITPHEMNLSFFMNIGGYSMCTTFHGLVSDIHDMANNLAGEMNRTDGSYDTFKFKYDVI